jgi:hypothetical protein
VIALERFLKALFFAMIVVAGVFVQSSKASANFVEGYQSPFTDAFWQGRGWLVTQYSVDLFLTYDAFVYYNGHYYNNVWDWSNGGCIFNAVQQERDWGVSLNVFVWTDRLYDDAGDWYVEIYPSYAGQVGSCAASDKAYRWGSSQTFYAPAQINIRGRVELHQIGVYGGTNTQYSAGHNNPYTDPMWTCACP